MRNSKANKRVVITGIGIVSSIGIGKEAFIESLFSGCTGASEIKLFNTDGYRTNIASYVKEIGKPDIGNGQKYRIYQFLDLMCDELIRDSKIDFSYEDMEEIGVAIGTCLGNVDCLERYYESVNSENNEVPVSTIINQPHFMPAAYIARKYGFKNVISVIDTACASSTNSIGYAFDRIRFGDAKVMVCGGVDPFNRLSHSGFGGLKSLSNTKTKPFTKDRDGLLLGEGGALVLLEELEHARLRNADIYAEVLGYGLSNDAYHETTPDPQGMGAQRAIENCLDDAGIGPEKVGYINAHGTGTQFNDQMELKAITSVFKEKAGNIPISTIKPMIGHALGAAGSLEFAASVLSITEKCIPPTINFTEPIEEYKDYDFVPNCKREVENLDVVISNSFAFGGNVACIAIGKYEVDKK